MKFLITDLCKLTKLEYKDAITELTKFDPSFQLKGGPQTTIPFNTFKGICQKYSIEVDKDGSIIIHKDNDNKVVFVPHETVKSVKPQLTYAELSLKEFNSMKVKKVDPLKVKAEFAQIPTNGDVVLEVLKGLTKEKTILNNSLIYDLQYLGALFQDYPFLLMPTQLGFRVRKRLEPLFAKTYLTDTFNNKMIAFNKDSALYAFIIVN